TAAVLGLQHMQDIYARDRSAPSREDLTKLGVPTWLLWNRGMVAMMPVARAALPFFTRGAKHKWKVLELPRGRTRVNPYFVPHMLAVHPTTQHPDLALELVYAMLSTEAQLAAVKAGLRLPPLMSQMSDPALVDANVADADLARATAAYHGDPSQLDLMQSSSAETLIGEIIDPQLRLLFSGAQSAEVTGRKIDELVTQKK
ncbi:MAG: hypothetical protein NTZ50_10015, partial [Chloroflexi bacterium]|nr:hypothetical protein [Chloroflexota bacterium]